MGEDEHCILKGAGKSARCRTSGENTQSPPCPNFATTAGGESNSLSRWHQANAFSRNDDVRSENIEEDLDATVGIKRHQFADQAVRYAGGQLRKVYFWPDELAGHVESKYHPGE